MGTPTTAPADPPRAASVVRWVLAVGLALVSLLGVAALAFGLFGWFASREDDGAWRGLGMLIGLVIAAIGFSVSLGAGLLSAVAWPRPDQPPGGDRVARPTRRSHPGRARALVVAAAVAGAVAVVATVGTGLASVSSPSHGDGVMYLWLLITYMAATMTLVLLVLAAETRRDDASALDARPPPPPRPLPGVAPPDSPPRQGPER